MQSGRTVLERLKGSWLEKTASLVLASLIPLATLPEAALALPHGGVVTKGGATLSYGTSKLLIGQSTQSASFSWSSYNVGSTQSVQYKTPGSSSVSMNFIGGTTPAQIAGKVTSNGQLVFMDPNGIVFGSGSTVSAAGIRAYGAASATAPPTGAVANNGVLTAGEGGQIVLVGTSVTNTGTIVAPSGQVVLAAGSTVTVSQSPSSSLSVATTGGGSVYDSGVIRVENVGGTPGRITLQSGMGSGTTTLASAAVLDASAPIGGNGGRVAINASEVLLDNATPIDVSAPYGTPGTVSIDPNLILSGTTLDICNAAGLSTIDGNQASLVIGTTTTDPLTDTINLETNINMADGTLPNGTSPYAWTPLGTSSSSAFTGTFNGNGHLVSGYTITAATNNGTGFIGYLGTGGVVENLGVSGIVSGGIYSYISGVVGYNYSGTVKASYNTGSVSGKCDVGGIVGWNYSGTVEYSYNTGSVNGSGSAVGGVVGYNSGTVEYSYNTGNVTGSGNFVGGVMGENAGTVEYSYNTGSVSGSGSDVGGVVGENAGTVTDDYYTQVDAGLYEIGYGSGSGTLTGELSLGTASGDFGSSVSYPSAFGPFASGWTGTNFGTNPTGPWLMGTIT